MLAYFCPLAFSNIRINQMKKILLTCASFALSYLSFAQSCSDIFISEYVEGTFNNKAIELYNPTDGPIVLDGNYKMGRDRDGAGEPMFLNLQGTIAAHDVRVFVLDKQDPNGTGNEIMVDLALAAVADTFVNPVYVQTDSPMYFNGDDAFVLAKTDNTILDIIGKIGEDPGSGWYVPSDPFTRWWTVDNTMIRKPAIDHGVLSNPSVFDPSIEWDSLPANTFDSLGYHFCVCGVVNIPETEKDPSFSMFPNPISHGQFALKSDAEMISFSILSADGKLIYNEKLGNGSFNTNVTMPAADAGVYMVEITFANGKKKYQKIVSR